MISKNELVKAIRKKSSEYSDYELFTSPYLEGHVQNIIESMCLEWKRFPKLKLTYNPKSDDTASTNGMSVECNVASPLIRDLPDTYSKFTSLFGHIVHETGHVLYTDFTALNPLRANWSAKTFSYYPQQPRTPGAKEFKDYLNSHPNYRKIYVTDMCQIVNVMEDVYIENRIRSSFSGLATAGLEMSNREKYRLFPKEEELYQKVLDGKITPLRVAVGLIQMKMLGFSPKTVSCTIEQENVRNEVYACINSVSKELNELAWESDGIRRCYLFNILFVKLQSLLPKKKEQQDSQNNNSENSSEQDRGESGSGSEQANASNQHESDDSDDYSDEEKDNLSQTPEKSISVAVSVEPEGDTAPVDSKIDKNKAETEKEDAKTFADSKEAAKAVEDELRKSIASSDILDKDEQDITKELEKIARDIMDNYKVGCVDFRGYNIVRASYKEADNYYSKYQEEYSEVSKYATVLARKLGNILKDNSEIDECERGFLLGQRLSSNDLYRKDGRVFSRINLPGDKKKVVFSILVDCSGSMGCRDKYLRARKASIIIEDALRKINVPTFIAGHTTIRSNSLIDVYVTPDSRDNKDRYRLERIVADSSNIDGAAIKYMSDLLLKRPEEIKVLIVISDGLPSGRSFYDADPNKDTMEAIKQARKKGINVFGAFVDDFATVSQLYSPQFSFDCSGNFDILVQQLTMIIKRYIRVSNN